MRPLAVVTLAVVLSACSGATIVEDMGDSAQEALDRCEALATAVIQASGQPRPALTGGSVEFRIYVLGDSHPSGKFDVLGMMYRSEARRAEDQPDENYPFHDPDGMFECQYSWAGEKPLLAADDPEWMQAWWFPADFPAGDADFVNTFYCSSYDQEHRCPYTVMP